MATLVIRLCISSTHPRPSPPHRGGGRNASKLGLNLDSVSGPRPALPNCTPCGRPSLDRPDGHPRDGCPQSLISNRQMTMKCTLLILFNPKIKDFRPPLRLPITYNRLEKIRSPRCCSGGASLPQKHTGASPARLAGRSHLRL
jgi:hypothetical protein